MSQSTASGETPDREVIDPTLSTTETETQPDTTPPERDERSAAEAEDDEGAAPPLPSFEDFGIPEALLESIAAMGWIHPTPVQVRCFSSFASGRDVMVQSHTGSGKTGAFCIPWLAGRFDPRPAHETGVQLLVVLPTRELAKQVCVELDRLSRDTPVTALPVYGGTPMQPQLAALSRGVHAVVGTPGRILDHVRRRSLDLSTVRTVILDECDEMLSMGFLEDIRAILERCTGEHQTGLFSATLPTDIQKIARRYMHEPELIELSGDSVAAAAIEHVYYSVSSAVKTRDLVDILLHEDPARAIVFCNTREETKLVASVLSREGYDAEALSSDLTQAAREKVMGKMKAHRLRFLVATDVAARGIDISHVSHVINYSFPESAEVYVHRTGRTGRAGRKGVAMSLIGPRELGNFYYLKLQYQSITFTERHLPPAEEMTAARREAKLDSISQRFPELVSPEWIALARSLMQDPRGERIIALLLERAMTAARPPVEETSAPEPAYDDAPENWEERPRRRERSRDRDRDRDRDRRRGRERPERPEPSDLGRQRRRRRDRGEDSPAPEVQEEEVRVVEEERPPVDEREAPVPEDLSTETVAAAESTSDESERPSRRRRRRRRRRGRGAQEATSTEGTGEEADDAEDDAEDASSDDESTAPEADDAVEADDASDDDEASDDDDGSDDDAEELDSGDDGDESEDASDAQGADDERRSSRSSRRRRRRRRGKANRGNKAAPAAEVRVPSVSQAEILIDIDEQELSVVRDEYGGIDELDELTLKGRRRAVMDTLQEEVEIEDLSRRDANAVEVEVEVEVEEDDDELEAEVEAEVDADDDDDDDDDDDASATEATTDGAEPEADDAASESGAEADEADETDEADEADDDESSDRPRRKRKRRRRRKKASPAAPPELTAPPHKDFWEVWAARYTFAQFEDGPFLELHPEFVKPEPPPAPEPAVEPRRERSSRVSTPAAAPSTISSSSSDDDASFERVRLNVGRRHGHKAAHIRALLREHLGLSGRSVRDLTVRDASTVFRVSASDFARMQEVLEGMEIDGVVLELSQPDATSEAPLRAPPPSDNADDDAAPEADAATRVDTEETRVDADETSADAPPAPAVEVQAPPAAPAEGVAASDA
ncbi:MAG: DEAD/DEAH box helicase [Nannocystaceae bacterium]